MNRTSIVAALAGAVTSFVLGYIIYGLLFADFFQAHAGTAVNAMKGMDEVSLPAIFLGELCGAALLTIIYGHWASIKTFAAGAKAGAIFGLLISLAFNLTLLGTMNINDLTAVLVDAPLAAIRIAIAGGVVGLLLGRESAAPARAAD